MRRDRKAAAAALVAESEAFLAGHLAEQMELDGYSGGDDPVPSWTWTNLLAHGQEQELREERAAVAAGRVDPSDEWRTARSYLAAEVMEIAELYAPLAEVQRAVLVPLELELATSPAGPVWGPRQWVVMVQTVLSQYQLECWRALRRRERPPSH